MIPHRPPPRQAIVPRDRSETPFRRRGKPLCPGIVRKRLSRRRGCCHHYRSIAHVADIGFARIFCNVV